MSARVKEQGKATASGPPVALVGLIANDVRPDKGGGRVLDYNCSVYAIWPCPMIHYKQMCELLCPR